MGGRPSGIRCPNWFPFTEKHCINRGTRSHNLVRDSGFCRVRLHYRFITLPCHWHMQLLSRTYSMLSSRILALSYTPGQDSRKEVGHFSRVNVCRYPSRSEAFPISSCALLFSVSIAEWNARKKWNKYHSYSYLRGMGGASVIDGGETSSASRRGVACGNAPQTNYHSVLTASVSAPLFIELVCL